MSDIENGTPSAGGAFHESVQAREIYISLWNDTSKGYDIHKLENISDDLKKQIGQYMHLDRDMHEGGYLYEYESFMDQLMDSGMEIMRLKEADLALKAISPDLGIKDGPPEPGDVPLSPQKLEF